MEPRELPVVKEVASTLSGLYGNRLSKIILYGSFARGDQHKDSDMDFFVVLKDKEVSPFREIYFYNEEMSRLSDKYSVEISVKAGTEEFLESENSLLARFIRKEGISIPTKL